MAKKQSNQPVEPQGEAQASSGATLDKSWKSIASTYVLIKEPQTKKALQTANVLAAQPKVPFTVFPTADEPDARLYWGGINGFFFAVVVGVPVELPKGIAEHITNSRIANARAMQSLIVTNPFTGQQVNVNLDHAADETKRRLGII